ncbi:hypothetical protein [Polynucleobacter sp. SHI2]|nr:hypothetical protein [Polynucleobacter sp. SHI2]
MSNRDIFKEIHSNTLIEPDINLERFKWKEYITSEFQRYPSSHKTNQERLFLTEYFHKQMYHENRILFHMTITYRPYRDRIYRPKDVNTFFINFYTKYLLVNLLGTRKINKPHLRLIQPITFTFIDEHSQDKFKKINQDGEYEYPDRLHHHSIISVHESNTSFFRRLREKNPFHPTHQYTKKILTSHIRECEPMTFLYVSKTMEKYPDYLCFPDRFH